MIGDPSEVTTGTLPELSREQSSTLAFNGLTVRTAWRFGCEARTSASR